MKTTKFLTTSAVATALLPIVSLAAIDDQGMQYVTAAEGLHGSLRVNILHNKDVAPDATFTNSAVTRAPLAASDENTGGAKESLRLWITGSGDIGNGWATTYYWEVRDGNRDANGDGNNDAGVIGTEAWTVGLKGPFGAFDFGRSAMVAPRMVPGGSLDTIVGGNAAHFACDVCDNTHRFESASFNGFQFGVSGVTNGDEGNASWTEDDLFDEYSFALKYLSPLGFQVGAGYEVRLIHDERFAGNAAAADYDDKSGWRIGGRYGRDNWLLGYEYRNYEGHSPWETNLYFSNLDLTQYDWFDNTALNILETGTAVADVGTAVAGLRRRPPGSKVTDGTDFNSRIGYEVHRMGAQIKFDKITASAGYSIEKQSLDVIGATDLDRTALAVDAAYHLGLNSLIAVGWKQEKTEQWARGAPGAITAISTTYAEITAIGRTQSSKTTTTQLYYRVDF